MFLSKGETMMKFNFSFVLAFIFISVVSVLAQNNQTTSANENSIMPNAATFDVIARELVKISKSVSDLNLKLKNFSDTFTSNQGLRLTDKQQKLLAAFEFLNRAEQRLSTLQKLKFDLSEKQTSIRVQIARVENDLRPESIDRSVAVRGTTDAEELRENRRRILSRQRNDLLSLVSEIQNSIESTETEIRQTELFLKTIRQRIFPEIERELSDL